MREKNEELEDTLEKLKEAQQQLIMQEKMVSLGNLVAGIAHEMNTPMGAINSAADTSVRSLEKIIDLLEKCSTLGTEEENIALQKALDILKSNNQVTSTACERVVRLVRSLKNFARLDESDFQKTDIHEGIDSTLTLVQHNIKNRIEVKKEYGAIPEINCYPNELNQVFMNLLVNASQAIQETGEIKIKTGKDNDSVYIKISDDGEGIAPENVKKIFDPGFTTKGVSVGTGLGLAISYNIIQKHSGNISVQSEVGKGTEFTVTLPIDRDS